MQKLKPRKNPHMVDFSKLLTEEEKEEIRKHEEHQTSLPRQKIKAVLIHESGRWVPEFRMYENITFREEIRELEMILQPGDRGDILRFIGGPSGYEGYYVEDFLRNIHRYENDELCICAGTINRYAKCTVSLSEVEKFIHAYASN